MRATLLGCILAALMVNGCIQRDQNRLLIERLDNIDKLLRERIKIEIKVQPNRPLSIIDQRGTRDT